MKRYFFLLIAILITHNAYAQQDKESLAFSFSNQGDCVKALEHASVCNSELVKKIIITRSIFNNKCSHISFDYVVNFVEQYPNWSQNESIKKRMESLASLNIDRRIIAQWFSKNSPKTPEGYKHYAMSLSSPSKDILKQAWINGTFNEKEMSDFLRSYAELLTYQDHVARIESLLWSDRLSEAKEMLSFIKKDDQRKYVARMAIASKDANLEKIFHKLHKADKYDSGVLYSYFKYKKSKKLPVTSEELSLATHIPIDVKNADKWWEMRSYYVRELMQMHKYREAYRLVINHSCKERLHITQAEWLAGFISLRFLHKPHFALKHFENVYNNSSRPITLARGAYWIARSYKDLRDSKQSVKWFEIAAQYGNTFYGQMSQHELGYKTLRLPKEKVLSQQDLQKFSKLEGPKIIELLIKYNQNHLVLVYLKNLFSISGNAEYVAYIMHLLKDSDSHSLKVEAAREAAFYGVFKKDYAYPIPFQIKKPMIESSLIYSIIRQESSFEQTAVDPTDGRGLMQLIPPTARKMAKSLGVSYDEERLLKSIDYNIMLGSKHLADHIKYYNGSYLLAIPSYNAGSHRVDRWVRLNGDPRKMKDLYKVLDWIERIPFSTTRDYVHRILENLQIYRSIIKQDASLHIVKDLTHKKGKQPCIN